MKIQIEDKYFLNIVLQLDENIENDLNDQNLDIIKLINNCKQIKKLNNEKRRINKLSDIIYIIIDRIKLEYIEKTFCIYGIKFIKFRLYEKIYYNNKLGSLSKISSSDSIAYELKFIIAHKLYSINSGHYTAYLKIKGEWYHFNDLDPNCASKTGNPAEIFKADFYPVCFFYVKSNI